jgi:hypothetical protein
VSVREGVTSNATRRQVRRIKWTFGATSLPKKERKAGGDEGAAHDAMLLWIVPMLDVRSRNPPEVVYIDLKSLASILLPLLT